ncbi:MAG: hypothetical protein RR198_04770, partial [Oscillospiraceae bacterium]
ILVAVAVPVYNNATKKAAKQTCDTNCRTIESAIMQIEAVSGSKFPEGEVVFGTNAVQVADAADENVKYTINGFIKGDVAPVCKVKTHDTTFKYWYGKGKVVHAVAKP